MLCAEIQNDWSGHSTGETASENPRSEQGTARTKVPLQYLPGISYIFRRKEVQYMEGCMNKKSYPGIDLFKLIAAVLVVWLHATETSNPIALGIQFTFTRFCVPFFFICSGFFFCSGLNRAVDAQAYFFRYEKRLLTLFAFYGVVISGPIAVSDYIRNTPDARPLRLALLIFRRVFVIGSGAYWYLVALILTSIFFYICWKNRWNGLLVFAMVAGQTLQTGYSSFQGLITSIPVWNMVNRAFYVVFSWDANFIMSGIPLFGIGWLLCKHNISVSRTVALGGWMVFTILRIGEFILPRISPIAFCADNDFSIAYIPQAVMFFFLACHCAGVPRYAKTFRQLSTFIYLTHWIILYNILDPVLLSFGINIYDPWLIPMKVAATLAVCLGLDWLLKRSNNKPVYFLIGG